jgi:ribosome-associated protein
MAGTDDLRINANVSIPGDELSVTVSRSSGPGGQHVNTTESRVQLRWNVASTRALGEVQRARVLTALASRLTGDGDLLIACEDERSQLRNRELARIRLAELVRRALVPPKQRRKTAPSRAARERRLQEKKLRGDRKRQRRGPVED